MDLRYAYFELQSDRQIVLRAVRQNGRSLEFASNEILNDKEIILAAVSNYGSSLKYASSYLQNDKEIVLAAVSNCGNSLAFASDELKNDKEVVLMASFFVFFMNVGFYKCNHPVPPSSQQSKSALDLLLLLCAFPTAAAGS